MRIITSLRHWLGGLCVALLSAILMPEPTWGIESEYEPGADPAVGFNLISWWNFGASGAGIWENAVQSIYDAGFRDLSVGPVRYFDPATGVITASSPKGPELSHVAAGITRAKSLGMTVTVNPFVEYENFAQWRGNWNPTPGSPTANQFWGDYEQYLIDVAEMAEANGADFMNVGTELKSLVQNDGHNSNWNTVIGAVDQQFSGALGYAANWDNFKNENLRDTIWEHSAIDYLGIDAYFPAATDTECDTSGAYPDPTFIGVVEDNWHTMFDDDIVPFAEARKGGQGMPIVFTEYGILPFNRGVAQHSDGSLDQDEQIMGFEALLNAMDHRQADDDVLAMHVWQWGMPGSEGSLWNMNLTPPMDQPDNLPATQFLSDFVSHPVPEPSSLSLAALGLFCLALYGWRRRKQHPRQSWFAQASVQSRKTDIENVRSSTDL